MKYPYIGKGSKSGAVLLFFREGEVLTLDCGVSAYSWHEKGIKETLCTNITREYLANTYGEVVSHEHAEFIIELAENAGYSLINDYEISDFFFITKTKFGFSSKGFCSIDAKQIKIPLPPKADKQELSEWPQVGDEVRWSNGCYKGVVKARHWNDLWVMESGGEFSTLYIDDISKPKTPEEELRDNAIKDMSQSIRNKIPKIIWDEAESISADLYDFGYRKPQ